MADRSSRHRRVLRWRQPAAKDEPGEKKGLDRGGKQDRKEAAVAKNIDASKRQPASLDKIGADSDKNGKASLPEVSEMTFEEFAALPEATSVPGRGVGRPGGNSAIGASVTASEPAVAFGTGTGAGAAGAGCAGAERLDASAGGAGSLPGIDSRWPAVSS